MYALHQATRQYEEFEANGIEIPYPQRDVHIKDHS